MSALTVGFLGLGFMGSGMAQNILSNGFPLIIMAHRRREALEKLVADGAKEAPDLPTLAAQCDVIILCVTGDEQVDSLVRGSAGIGAHAQPGTIILDCTTSRPATIRSLAQDFSELVFIDAPLGRSPKEALEGRLSVMVGASEADLSKARPVIDAFADTIQHVGSLGTGHSLKLVNNMVSLGYAALYSESLVMAQKAGISIAAFDELISSSRMDCLFFQTFMGWVRTGDATSHKFALSAADHAVTDAYDEAKAAGLDLKLLRAVRQVYSDAANDGMGESNLPELPRGVALRNGIPLLPDQM